MKAVVGIDQLAAQPAEPHVVTIGTFDGVHLGHRALIARTIAEATDRSVASAVVTWDRHPNATIRPDKTPALLASAERKAELIGETGVDVLAVLPFDEAFSKWPPERFIEEVLVRGLGAVAVFVGEGWRFGHKATGTVELLVSQGEEHGFDAEGLGLTSFGDAAVSSTRIRALIAEGDVEGAAGLLGRPYDIDGTVVHGDGRGRELGYPTANLDVEEGLARPAKGIYAARAGLGGSWFPAAVSIGVNPTFGEGGPVRIEAYLLDLDRDLYGESLRIEFISRLRDEMAFDSVDDLVAQIDRDVEETRRITS